MKKKYIKIILFIVALVLLDQFTKFLVTKNFYINESLVIINNFFSFTYVTNTGAAFGVLSNNIILLSAISTVIIWYIVKQINNSLNKKLELFSLCILLSGAIGNLIDRVVRNYVVDFISFKLFGRQMPIFNIADIFVTVGVMLLIICIIKGEKHGNKNK